MQDSDEVTWTLQKEEKDKIWILTIQSTCKMDEDDYYACLKTYVDELFKQLTEDVKTH